MWKCEDKLKRKPTHFRLPPWLKKIWCLSPLPYCKMKSSYVQRMHYFEQQTNKLQSLSKVDHILKCPRLHTNVIPDMKSVPFFFSSIIIEVKAKFILKIFVIRKRKRQKKKQDLKITTFCFAPTFTECSIKR